MSHTSPGSLWFCDTCILIRGLMPQYKFFPGPSRRGCRQCLEVTQSHGAIGLSQGPCPATPVPASPFISQECVTMGTVCGRACDNLAHGGQFAFGLSLTPPGKRTLSTYACKTVLGKRSPNFIADLSLSSPGYRIGNQASMSASVTTQAGPRQVMSCGRIRTEDPVRAEHKTVESWAESGDCDHRRQPMEWGLGSPLLRHSSNRGVI